jgi:hypothetical protein
MKTFEPAPASLRPRVDALIKRFYPDLIKAEVKIDLIFVTTDGEGSALSHGGYPALAVVKIVGTKERAMDRGDAEIVIDQERFENMDEKEQDALLDHELYHLELKKDGAVFKVDTNGRPRLGCKKHDRQFGWFDEIARRHGEHAVEVKQALHLKSEAGQLYFPLNHKRRAAAA